jgi:galactokinase
VAATQLGVPQLRDLTSRDLPRLRDLPEELARRARHVITEDDRVLEAVEALEAEDLPRLGGLFYASHASMRDDFEVSTPEIDLLVDLARTDSDVYGARLTGGGFGGAVVMFARAGSGRAAGQRLAEAYAAKSGCTPTLLVPS